jgi:hypothetical protein
LLSLLLGNHERVLGLGDTIPPRYFVTSGCGCGSQLNQCEFWNAVQESLSFVGQRALVPELPTRVVPKGRDGPVWRSFPVPENRFFVYAEVQLLRLFCLLAIKFRWRLPFKKFAASYADFLSVCASFYDFEIFVDGFKDRTRYLAMKACGLPVRGVIHLVRDPRAYAAATKRAGLPLDKIRWNEAHADIEYITRRSGENVMLIRYEDLCKSPQQVLQKVQTWMGLIPRTLVRTPRDSLHWLGNESLANFRGEIRASERWRQELSQAELAFVRRASGRAASRYGFDLDE